MTLNSVGNFSYVAEGPARDAETVCAPAQKREKRRETARRGRITSRSRRQERQGGEGGRG